MNTELKTLEDAKKHAIIEAVTKTKSVVAAADILKVSRATLYRLMNKYQLSRRDLCK